MANDHDGPSVDAPITDSPRPNLTHQTPKNETQVNRLAHPGGRAVTVHTADDRDVTVTAEWAGRHDLRHAYAMTLHKAQGTRTHRRPRPALRQRGTDPRSRLRRTLPRPTGKPRLRVKRRVVGPDRRVRLRKARPAGRPTTAGRRPRPPAAHQPHPRTRQPVNGRLAKPQPRRLLTYPLGKPQPMITKPCLRPLPEDQVVHIAVPDMPPVLTPAACHALPNLLRTHSRRLAAVTVGGFDEVGAAPLPVTGPGSLRLVDPVAVPDTEPWRSQQLR
jgi:hypothetical protein